MTHESVPTPRQGERRLLDLAPAALFEADAEGVWTWCSLSCRALLGLEPDDPVPERLQALAVEEDRDLVAASWRAARENGSPLSCDFRIAAQHGRPRWVRARALGMEQDGRALVVGVLEDLTVERLREEALLAETQRAREASRLKSEFLAVMSHELRTPIHGVVGTAGLLQGTDLSEEQRELVDMLMQSADATLSVVNNILDISRIEAGRLELESVEFELVALVESAVGVAAARAQEKGIELVHRIDPRLASHYRGDGQRLRQVLLNLVSNAVKFTETGEVVVHVARLDDADGPELLRFEVRDTGIGISAEARARLFEAFTQADASITRRFGGSGLGLTIARSLVGMMGGVIGVEGEEGRGSTFWFTVVLPRGEGRAEETSESLRDLRVLVVDDNASVRAALAERLDAWGLRSETAAGADEAAERLCEAAAAADPVRIVLLDSELREGGDARALLTRARGDAATGQPAVVLLTPFGRRGRSEAAGFHGLSGQMPKPVRTLALRDTLRAILEGRDDGPTAGRPPRRGPALRRPPSATIARVLVVDDNAVGRRVAEKVLERRGCVVETAVNGVEAVRKVKEGAYSLVLMDCLMPEMDGYEATRLIRRWEEGRGRHVPIVAMTARAMEGDRERALGPGMDDYLCKPVRNEELDAVLERWIASLPPAPADGAPGRPGGDGIGADGPLPAEDAVALDPAPLRELHGMQQGMDEDIVAELMGMFNRDTPARMEALRTAFRGEDAHAVERVAHGLKGSAASLGAVTFAEICRRLERRGRERRLEGAEDTLDRLDLEFQRVIRALREWKPA